MPRIKPTGRAARNLSHPRRDTDLAHTMPQIAGHVVENWPQIASAAWAGYLVHGRGLTIVDTRTTYPVPPTGLSHTISYPPAKLVTAADEARYRASDGA